MNVFGVTATDPGGDSGEANGTNSPAGGASGQSVHTHAVPPHRHHIGEDTSIPPFVSIIFLMKR